MQVNRVSHTVGVDVEALGIVQDSGGCDFAALIHDLFDIAGGMDHAQCAGRTSISNGAADAGKDVFSRDGDLLLDAVPIQQDHLTAVDNRLGHRSWSSRATPHRSVNEAKIASNSSWSISSCSMNNRSTFRSEAERSTRA